MNRRDFIRIGAVAPIVWATHARADAADRLATRCRQLEAEIGGRLGVSVLTSPTGPSIGHRADERFPMCSTFKWLAAAALLAQVDAGRLRLGQRIRFDNAALMDWAPVTKHRVGGAGMTLAELCDAAVTESDNTAAGLILDEVGGIEGWNRYVRSIGDTQTRLDRGEPQLNEALPDDPRDTTTPAAMARDLQIVLLGNALTADSRRRLTDWMLATRTSGQRLRADLAPGWRLADKTGTGDHGSAADVGVYWPPSGAPMVVAVYVTEATAPRTFQEAAIADIGRWLRAGRLR